MHKLRKVIIAMKRQQKTTNYCNYPAIELEKMTTCKMPDWQGKLMMEKEH
jgi:hypothetical protein